MTASGRRIPAGADVSGVSWLLPAVVGVPPWLGDSPEAVVCAGDCAPAALFGEAADIVIVLPLLLKLAIKGEEALIVSSAAPLLSVNAACVITLLPNDTEEFAGGTSGSRENTITSLPGSVEIVGFTGAVKFSTSREGLVWSS